MLKIYVDTSKINYELVVLIFVLHHYNYIIMRYVISISTILDHLAYNITGMKCMFFIVQLLHNSKIIHRYNTLSYLL